MDGRTMDYCCGIEEIGNFPTDSEESKEHIKDLFEDVKAGVGSGRQIATVSSKQSYMKKLLLSDGFVEFGTFRGQEGIITLLGKGFRVKKASPTRVTRRRRVSR